MRIQRLQTRIIVFFVALLALVQVAAFWFVNAANSNNAHAKIEEGPVRRQHARVCAGTRAADPPIFDSLLGPASVPDASRSSICSDPERNDYLVPLRQQA